MAKLPVGLPSSRRIGWRDYEVIPWEHKDARDKQRYAEHDGAGWKIRLDVLYSPREIANGLIHEILHALYQVVSVEGDDDEERTVTGLANGLVMVWRDNPKTFAWISGACA